MTLQVVDPNLDAPASMVANELNENNKGVLKAINRAIQLVGMGKVVEIVQKAKEVHGTLMIEKGTRPRTLGGCFFYLLRQELGEKFDLVQKPFKPKSVREEEQRGKEARTQT